MVSGADDGARGICQNPELASSFVNTLAVPVSDQRLVVGVAPFLHSRSVL